MFERIRKALIWMCTPRPSATQKRSVLPEPEKTVLTMEQECEIGERLRRETPEALDALKEN